MTIKEFEEIVKKENNQIVVAISGNEDVYVINSDEDEMKILAWICGSEADHFTIYSGLSDRKSWNAVYEFAETLPNKRGLLQQQKPTKKFKKVEL